MVGLKEPTLGNFETGRAGLSSEALNRLSKVYGVAPAELLEEMGVAEHKEEGPEYRSAVDPETIRWLVRGYSDEQVIEKIAAALRDGEMEWKNRLATARALVDVLEARSAGE